MYGACYLSCSGILVELNNFLNTSDNLSSLPALLKALDDLDDLFRVIHGKYKADLAKREYERFHEEG